MRPSEVSRLLWTTAFLLVLIAEVQGKSPGLEDFLDNKRSRVYRRSHQNAKRTAAASSSSSLHPLASSSSSFVGHFSASSTFEISFSSTFSGSTKIKATPTPASCGSEDCKFYSSKTKPYFISEWPDVDFDTGEFYGGSVPINESDPSRQLFWIFKPAEGDPVKEITIWLNGGPGCSSLEGFLQENGPIQFKPGTAHPSRNPLAWSRLTNMIWVEQPVGTGFSQGKVTAKNEIDVAKDFAGFFKNWQKLFGIENYKIYITACVLRTGESYAGRYIPYISAEMLDLKDKKYFDLSGALMYDPCIGDCFGPIQGGIPTSQFAIDNQAILNFNPSTLQAIKNLSSTCGMNAFMEKYLSFPPPGNQPNDHSISNLTRGCDPIYTYYIADTTNKNECFDNYHITNYCPVLHDPLTEYFNRDDVKKAIHAPDIPWEDCKIVFVGNDQSPPSIYAALPQVIESTNRVLVSNGDWDSLIYTKGTLLSIQNMTWNGQLGFQREPRNEFFVPIALEDYNGPQGVMGIAHYERGLMWVETYQAGHQQPQFQPRAAWRHLQWLLGRIDKLWK